MCKDEQVIITFPSGHVYEVPLRVVVYFTKGSKAIDKLLNKGQIDEAMELYKSCFDMACCLSRETLTWRTLAPYAKLLSSPDSELFDIKTAKFELED